MTRPEDGIQTQLRNIERTYGHTIEELVAVVEGSGLAKHPEVVAMLKQRFGMTHGNAHRVALVARQRPAAPAATGARRASGVESLLLEVVGELGPDVEAAPKKGYVSFRRRRQFAMVQPGARWVNVGLILRDHPASPRLEPAEKWNALFTHRVRVGDADEVDGELRGWLRQAYEAAG